MGRGPVSQLPVFRVRCLQRLQSVQWLSGRSATGARQGVRVITATCRAGLGRDYQDFRNQRRAHLTCSGGIGSGQQRCVSLLAYTSSSLYVRRQRKRSRFTCVAMKIPKADEVSDDLTCFVAQATVTPLGNLK